MSPEEIKAANIAFVRSWFRGSYVGDKDALQSFNEGRGVFDVDPDAAKLLAFVKQHGLRVRGDNGNLPFIRCLLDYGPLYLAFRLEKAGKKKG